MLVCRTLFQDLVEVRKELRERERGVFRYFSEVELDSILESLDEEPSNRCTKGMRKKG